MKTLKRYLSILTLNDIKSVFPATIAAFIETAFSIIPTILTFEAVQIMSYRFIDPEKYDLKMLKWIAIGMVLSVIGQYVVGIFSYKVTNLKTYNEVALRRKQYIKKLIQRPLGFFERNKVNELVVSFVNDFRASEIIMSYFLPQVLSLSVFSFLIIGFLLVYNLSLGLSFFLPLPFVIITFVIASKLKKSAEHRIHEEKMNVQNFLTDYIFGMKILRNYNDSIELTNQLMASYDGLRKASIKNETGAGALSFVSINLISLAIPAMSMVAAVLFSKGELSVIDYVSVLVFTMKVTVPMTIQIICLLSLRTHLMTQGRLMKVMKYDVIKDDDIHVLEKGVVEFQNVNFAYDEEQVLKNINLKIQPNQMTALVGPSGSGKTTLVKLLARFYEPQRGQITMSDVSVQDVSVEAWLSQISMVTQKPYLFHMSVKENIAYGQSHVPMEDVIRAAKEANCHDFIMELSEGYETIISEGGLSLSGGERQRIGIARALLKDADIIILDEPTSSLDFENEYMVQQGINRLIKDKTVIMISHRLNTIAHADQIVVMNQGEISGIGKHEDLMKENVIYKGLIDHALNTRTI